MTTIRRNWAKRIDTIKAAAKFCRAYESSTGNMVTVDPAYAFKAWQANRHATLRENTPGQKWTVHVHSNSFYILTATDPHQDRRKTDTAAPTPVPPAAPRTAAAPAHSTEEEAVLQDVREYIQDAPGIGVQTAAAATAAIERNVQEGAIIRDRLTGALPSITAAVTAKAVADMRGQGLTHEQIRMRLERNRAEAVHAGNRGRVTVADVMLAAHAGIVADEDRARAAAARRLLAATAEERPAITAPPHALP